MQVRFLLGPAGSGKTFRCLTEIRKALLVSPDGPPLIFLAPKQATFQLERQLLADPDISGYTRLRILSFERLAEFIYESLDRPVPELLAEEGRVMVLRALLGQRKDELKLFRASARMPGFAKQLSLLLREFQHHHLTPSKLTALASRVDNSNKLRAKLHDLALIYGAYLAWLKTHDLEDADRLLEQAATLLRQRALEDTPRIASHVWLDGFAQMTPQELELLAALILNCDEATFAFCLDAKPAKKSSWLSMSSLIGQTFHRCHEKISALPECRVNLELLGRDDDRSRFTGNPILLHLEKTWEPATTGEMNLPMGDMGNSSDPTLAVGNSLRIVACNNSEQEAVIAAREILRHIRDGGRFRDVAILLRSLEGYHDAIVRALSRYEIPFFLDRRESVANHPLAELTRYALRTVIFAWDHDDWFGALKTGLTKAEDSEIDRLENEALARGWGGPMWLERLNVAGENGLNEWLERIRQKVVPPFKNFSELMNQCHRQPTGKQLSDALRNLWDESKVENRLENWSLLASSQGVTRDRYSAIHETVWVQMNAWRQNLELAFQNESMLLSDWLPIVEAGLGNLTVGIVPPGLDQVLIGTIDRSRNPDLRLAIVMGMNEGVFPARAQRPILLIQSDRDTLASFDSTLGPDRYQQIGLERYYGYIACTRARERLVLTYALRDAENNVLNPSPFIDHLRRVFPEVKTEEFSGAIEWDQAEHFCELTTALLKRKTEFGSDALGPAQMFESLPALQGALAKWDQLAASRAADRLSPELADQLHGKELHTSVSALEDFAACPFKFFAARGLRAKERIEFEVDPREKGTFQHELLKEFHRRLQSQGKRWREISRDDARKMVHQIGEELVPVYRDGLFLANPSRRFTAGMLIASLERLIETLVGWASQYEFEPRAVEVSFGLKDSRLPAWRIQLDAEHFLLLGGRVDRVDLFITKETTEALGVIIDYKSKRRELDTVLVDQGLELQLVAYLGALSEIKPLNDLLPVARILPAGVFYVGLKNSGGSAKSRNEEREKRESARYAGFQHRGRFNGEYLDKFDNRGLSKGDQFRYSKKKDGAFSKVANEALSRSEFQALLSTVKEFLRRHGREIYAGRVDVSPFRWKQKTACDFCDYRCVCRFDPWTQPFRILRPAQRDPEFESDHLPASGKTDS